MHNSNFIAYAPELPPCCGWPSKRYNTIFLLGWNFYVFTGDKWSQICHAVTILPCVIHTWHFMFWFVSSRVSIRNLSASCMIIVSFCNLMLYQPKQYYQYYLSKLKQEFLQDRPWISPWTRSISDELDISFHVLASQLAGHCHQQSVVTSVAERKPNEWNIRTMFDDRRVNAIYGIVMSCVK